MLTKPSVATAPDNALAVVGDRVADRSKQARIAKCQFLPAIAFLSFSKGESIARAAGRAHRRGLRLIKSAEELVSFANWQYSAYRSFAPTEVCSFPVTCFLFV